MRFTFRLWDLNRFIRRIGFVIVISSGGDNPTLVSFETLAKYSKRFKDK